MKQAHFRFYVTCEHQIDVLVVLLRELVVPTFLGTETQFTFTTCKDRGFLFLSVPFGNDAEACHFIWGVEEWLETNGLHIHICSDYSELDRSPVFASDDDLPF